MESNNNFNFYENTKYNYNRIKRQTLVLDIDKTLNGDDHDFSLLLDEPLIIDTKSEIYLDSFTTYSCKANTGTNGVDICFAVGINEFNIKTIGGSAETPGTTFTIPNTDPPQTNTHPSYPANPNLKNKIIIPNEQDDDSPDNKMKIHKGKKLNYICQIDPCKLRKISGSITNLGGATAFSAATSRVLIEFLIVSQE